ncbi:MAG: Smr/MutS family protein, partial [Candidatus Riflebacteria bacterium]|nr:Smr/MutS family protein [Candidatus Riflebacteria bacterium]
MERKTLDNLEFPKILGKIAIYASSRAAKDKILKLEPSTDANEIRGWLSEIEDYKNYSEAGIRLNTGAVNDIRELIEILNSGSTVLGSDDFLKVRANIQITGSLKKNFEAQTAGWTIKPTDRIAERIKAMPPLIALCQRIDDCLDDHGQIKNTASPTLASIRREFSKNTAEIEKQLNLFLNSHADDIQDHYFTLRNERYVVPVSASSQGRIQGIVHDQSATGQTLFIEPLQFLPMNNRLAQLRLSEREEIRKILTALTAVLCQSKSAMVEQFETLIWLDTVRARSEFAVNYNCHCPEISTEHELVLNKARHPLLHPNCVPLDIKMNKEQRCIIITGPNGGGKTVSLKTTGINALLMQTGNFVLADADAKLPIFSQILSDIGESQSIEDHLSTFTAHLKRLKEISDLADGKSLILIDEICVGTDPIEGGALASGFLKEIARRGAFSIVTSHYDSLKKVAFTTPGFINAAMEFDYETFKPTFRFCLGIPGKSNALAMARSFGLPEVILQDLVEANSGEHKDEKGLIEAIERERNRAEALRRSYVQKLTALRTKEAEVEETLTQLREFRKTKRDKLTEEYTSELRNKMRTFEALISSLKTTINKNSSNSNAAEELMNALEEARNAHAAVRETKKSLEEQQNIEENEARKAIKEIDKAELKKGVEVIWKQNMRKGLFVKLSGKENAEVDFDGIVMRVKISDLALAPNTNSNSNKAVKQVSGAVYAVTPLVRTELDLRGMRVEEALDELDSYMKTVADTDAAQVFIIHGKGTGALQKAVENYFKNSRWKKKFRPGRYGEGDLGVTVVTFKQAEADEPAGYKRK